MRKKKTVQLVITTDDPEGNKAAVLLVRPTIDEGGRPEYWPGVAELTVRCLIEKREDSISPLLLRADRTLGRNTFLKIWDLLPTMIKNKIIAEKMITGMEMTCYVLHVPNIIESLKGGPAKERLRLINKSTISSVRDARKNFKRKDRVPDEGVVMFAPDIEILKKVFE